MRKKLLVAAAGILAFALLLCLPANEALPAGAWGLSYSQPGQEPAGPASSEQLQKLDAAFLGDKKCHGMK